MHNGIDFGRGYGAPVYATGNGVVISTSRLGGYGNAVIIEHGGGLSSVYGHLSRIRVSSGATVKRGLRIGSIGSSGLSTGPHLHFEIRQNGRPVNPAAYL
jgi:murein DD-endopeptidase MepM/ murein hydrolase activator NlpD